MTIFIKPEIMEMCAHLNFKIKSGRTDFMFDINDTRRPEFGTVFSGCSIEVEAWLRGVAYVEPLYS